jgi:hypothetical protein
VLDVKDEFEMWVCGLNHDIHGFSEGREDCPGKRLLKDGLRIGGSGDECDVDELIAVLKVNGDQGICV